MSKNLNFINNKKIKKQFESFYSIYRKRPILYNENGIKIEHAFYLYLVIKKIRPKIIIESGVFAGQSTWLMEKFSSNATFFCFDTNLKNLKYKSKKAKYYEHDLSKLNWSKIDKSNTLIFFDDHVSFYDRLNFSSKNKFKHLVFDDNYPPNIGDCYSFKKILSEKNQKYFIYEYFDNKLLASLKLLIKKIIGIKRFYGSKKVKIDKDKLKIYDPKRFIRFKKQHKISFYKNKDYYFEFPPLIKFDALKRWGKYKYLKKNDLRNFKVKKPIFKKNYISKIIKTNDIEEFSKQYNFFCYYKIKS